MAKAAEIAKRRRSRTSDDQLSILDRALVPDFSVILPDGAQHVAVLCKSCGDYWSFPAATLNSPEQALFVKRVKRHRCEEPHEERHSREGLWQRVVAELPQPLQVVVTYKGQLVQVRCPLCAARWRWPIGRLSESDSVLHLRDHRCEQLEPSRQQPGEAGLSSARVLTCSNSDDVEETL